MSLPMAGLGTRGSLRSLPTGTMLGACDVTRRAGHWERSTQAPRDRLCDSPALPPGREMHLGLLNTPVPEYFRSTEQLRATSPQLLLYPPSPQSDLLSRTVLELCSDTHLLDKSARPSKIWHFDKKLLKKTKNFHVQSHENSL